MTKIINMFKTLAFIIATIAVSSCAVSTPKNTTTLKTTERRIEVYAYDFRPYTAKGFYFSPNPYPGNFEPIGQLTINVFPALKLKTEKIYSQSYGGGEDENVQLETEKITTEQILDIAFNKTKEMGGDAIVNFKIRWIKEPTMFGASVSQYLDHYEIEGFAIKRK